MVLVLRAAFFFFFLVFWQAYGIYRIQTSKTTQKKAKILVKQIFVTPGFLMVWHPKTESQENTSAPPDLHQTVTTITGLPKKKNDNYLCAHGMCSCSCNNFMDAAIITLSSSTPPDTCRTCKLPFQFFIYWRNCWGTSTGKKKKKSVAVQKDKKIKKGIQTKLMWGTHTHTHTHTHVRAHTYACTRTHIHTKQAKERCGQDCC